MNKVLMYYQETNSDGFDRVRLIYPNGYVEYLVRDKLRIYVWNRSCYSFDNNTGKQTTKTIKQALHAMRKYDASWGWSRAELIGKL